MFRFLAHLIILITLPAAVAATSNDASTASPQESPVQSSSAGAAEARDGAEAKKVSPPMINPSAPAAPPESAEARIALRQHREVSALNRFTFKGNVLDGVGDVVDSWIVMFCPGWHDQCQGLLPSYELLGVQWENKLNKAVMNSRVRFAKVDCATEKALCVSLDIEDYPSVVHYQNGQAMGSWSKGAPGLVRFVKQQLEPPKRRPSATVKQAVKKVDRAAASSCDAAANPPSQAEPETQDWTGFRPLCFALILVAALHCAYVMTRRALQNKTNQLEKSSTLLAAGRGGASRRPAEQKHLPQEWLRDRRSIVL